MSSLRHIQTLGLLSKSNKQVVSVKKSDFLILDMIANRNCVHYLGSSCQDFDIQNKLPIGLVVDSDILVSHQYSSSTKC